VDSPWLETIEHRFSFCQYFLICFFKLLFFFISLLFPNEKGDFFIKLLFGKPFLKNNFFFRLCKNISEDFSVPYFGAAPKAAGAGPLFGQFLAMCPICLQIMHCLVSTENAKENHSGHFFFIILHFYTYLSDNSIGILIENLALASASDPSLPTAASSLAAATGPDAVCTMVCTALPVFSLLPFLHL